MSVKTRMDDWATGMGIKQIDTSSITPAEAAEAVIEWRDDLL